MRLKIRRLALQANTNGPTFGTTIDFDDGLNILRADNSSGKSTCLQAIIYGLGLEGMLSPRREVPLPHAMTDIIEAGGEVFTIESSYVSLEIENSNGEILAIRRTVRGQPDTSVIQTWAGPMLTDPGDWPQRDYFVRRPGAAQREAGFHFQLNRFLGWQTPRVTRMDGGEAPLYLEALFPYFYVEQKHGWSGVQARIPGYLGLREPGKRAVEFILGLDAFERVLTRQRLISARSILESDWKSVARALSTSAESAGVVVRGDFEKPSENFEISSISYTISTGQVWSSLDDEIDRLAAEVARSQRTPIRRVDQVAKQGESELLSAQNSLTNAATALSAVMEEVESNRRRKVEIESRIDALDEDLQRHRDLRALKRLGASQSGLLDDYSICPTCHQELRDGMEISHAPMSIDENITFIEQELQTFRAMLHDVDRVSTALAARELLLREQVTGLRRRVRVYKQALSDVDSTPSATDIAERIRVEDRHEDLIRKQAELIRITRQLSEISTSWRSNSERLRAIGEVRVDESDLAKLRLLEKIIREQLKSYGFGSLQPDTIEVSDDTYRPTHEGFDLGFDLSASDMIRLIWSYLLGLLETSLRSNGNHPAFLVFDEPRQQDTAPISFERLLSRSAWMTTRGVPVQIIFATSESEGTISEMVNNLPHRMISFSSERKILQPL
ncbi:AAA family ATPase [Protofrankia coriariae]|uniref:AAA family ATPase n=1 Tax=Protofrankia coriariae TaxID=1562887 RepID=UPI000A31F193|nr:AAA family ATPase [Protofrankia coriariae]